jgi:hypothetical protein
MRELETNPVEPELDERVYQDSDFCQLCAPDKRRAGLPPNEMVRLSRGTMRNFLIVTVCPECDGDAARLGTR